MNDIEKTFEYAKNGIRLSDTEKASTREGLLALMQERPMHASVRSPLSGFFLAPAFRYAMVAVVFLISGSGGIAYAAADAQPTDALYIVKVKVTEPVQVALTFDDKDRADLEVQLVDERLQDVADATTNDEITPDQLSLVTDSLSDHIDDAQETISNLQENEQPDDALEVATDLAATLTESTDVLADVEGATPEASSTLQDVAETVSDELSETTDLVETAQDAVDDDSSGDDSSVSVPSDDSGDAPALDDSATQ